MTISSIYLLRKIVPQFFVLVLFDSEIQGENAGRVARTEETKNAYILLVGNFKCRIHKLIFNTIREINMSSNTASIGQCASTKSDH
jgi:hypothetical protein